MQHSFPVRYSKKKLNRSIDITFIGSIFVGESLHNKRVNLIFELMKNFKNSFIAINFSKNFYSHCYLDFLDRYINFKFLVK